MTTICWDVDTQVDFIAEQGKLAVPGADAIRPALARLTGWAHREGIRVVATADDHDIGHAEISATPDWKHTYPPHCMRGTPGQRKITETALDRGLVIEPVPHDAGVVRELVREHRGDLLLHKPGTDIFRWNPNAHAVLEALAPERIVIYGVATDVCVVAAVDGLRRHAPHAELVVIEDAIRALEPARGRALLTEWAARGIRIAASEDVTA